MSVQDKSFYYRITAHDEQHNFLVLKVWSNLPWHTRNRFDWYFRYRTALFQVQNPKWRIDANWGSKLLITKEEAAHKDLLGKIIKNKSLITRYQNRLDNAVKNWSEIFPIHNNLSYKKLVSKIEWCHNELKNLQEKK